jgi:hypothetical protein
VSYNSNFQKDFIKRSLVLIKNYKGSYDATILINCLVGLLIVPNECYKKAKLTIPITEIGLWGIPKSELKSQTKYFDLNDFIRRLRNSVSHADFSPINESGRVVAFNFSDGHRFRVTITLQQLRIFATSLANKIKDL